MIMKIIFNDSTKLIGRRGLKEVGFINHETKGTHHFTVLDGTAEFITMVGQEVAVPINSVKYFVLDYQEESI